MKIALIGNEYVQQFPLLGYGGIESCVENLAYAMADNGLDFYCVVPKRDKKTLDRNQFPFEIIETDFIPSQISRKSPHDFISSVIPILHQRKPDIIWAQSYWSAPLAKALQRPLIITIHDSQPRVKDYLLNSPLIFYRYISQFQFNEWVKEEWQQRCSIHVYPGLEKSEYDFNSTPEDYFLWVAGLGWGWHNKGLPIFVELARRHPEKSFIAYGSRRFSVEFKLKMATWRLNNFEFRGSLPRGARHTQAFRFAKAFIFPTQIPEAMGRTILESLSKGTPVIGSENGALPEMIGKGGITSNSIDRLSEALSQPFDRRISYEQSLVFKIEHEVQGLYEFSRSILRGKHE